MSSLIVEVCDVKEILPHSNADKLELAIVKGWQCVIQKGAYKVGDKAVYFPPDSVIPNALADKFGITKYCSPLPKQNDGTRPDGMRIRASRFRGESAFGTIQPCDDPTWPVGMSVVDYYKVTKYEPPPKVFGGDLLPPVEVFHHYTDIENIRNFPDIFTEGEEVVVDEKIHGTNSRVGLVRIDDKWEFVAGSHNTRRKESDDKGVVSMYWKPLTENVRTMLEEISQINNETRYNVIVFGEIYGGSVQDMSYGLNETKFRAFDISVDGKYLSTDAKMAWFNKYNIEVVPHLYRGPFSKEKILELTDGPTTLCEPEKAGKFKGREGVVVRPAYERYHPVLRRVILKSISVDYLGRKDGTEYH